MIRNKKNRELKTSGLKEGEPGSDLLSHKRTLHYHRRGLISLLCSEREQVVLRRYCRRAKGLNLKQLIGKGKEYKLYFDFR